MNTPESRGYAWRSDEVTLSPDDFHTLLAHVSIDCMDDKKLSAGLRTYAGDYLGGVQDRIARRFEDSDEQIVHAADLVKDGVSTVSVHWTMDAAASMIVDWYTSAMVEARNDADAGMALFQLADAREAIEITNELVTQRLVEGNFDGKNNSGKR